MFLAVFCIGWAGVIYSHPIPEVDQDAIDATAAGKVALSQRRAEDARSDFTVALESEPDYLPALWGRALATLLVANPDVLDTMAVTDTSQSAIEPAPLTCRPPWTTAASRTHRRSRWLPSRAPWPVTGMLLGTPSTPRSI
ncbi:MAG: hypothetical protein R2714_11460 [Microthrixaceae bacterium]